MRPRIAVLSLAAMHPTVGVLAAILSSALGGVGAAATRLIVSDTDPVTLAALRFGIGFLCLLPVALWLSVRWPRRRDWIGSAALGLLFFGLFFVIYNFALARTTAARAALGLSVLPLLTMLAAALVGAERVTARKLVGALMAIGGVAVALASGLAQAPEGAWRGDLTMMAGTTCMALYNVWSRPVMARCSALAFLTVGMGAAAAVLAVVAASAGGLAALHVFGPVQWLWIFYLGAGAAALNFFLWVWALERTSPTRVASTITVSPLAAAIAASLLLGEPFGLSLALGIASVLGGIWIAARPDRT